MKFFESMASLSFCISSKAASQLPVKISAAIFPHVAERERSASVDYKNSAVSIAHVMYICTSNDAYQDTEMVEIISSASVITTVVLELAKLVQNVDGIIGKLDELVSKHDKTLQCVCVSLAGFTL